MRIIVLLNALKVGWLRTRQMLKVDLCANGAGAYAPYAPPLPTGLMLYITASYLWCRAKNIVSFIIYNNIQVHNPRGMCREKSGQLSGISLLREPREPRWEGRSSREGRMSSLSLLQVVRVLLRCRAQLVRRQQFAPFASSVLRMEKTRLFSARRSVSSGYIVTAPVFQSSGSQHSASQLLLSNATLALIRVRLRLWRSFPHPFPHFRLKFLN